MATKTPEKTDKKVTKDTKFKSGKEWKGNKDGRPKGSFSLIGILKRKLQEVDKAEQKTYAVLLIERMVKEAIKKGNDQQIKNILQYIEGMPKQTIDSKLEMSGLQELFKDARK